MIESVRPRRGAVAAALVLCAACGDADPLHVSLDLPGDYELTSISYQGQPPGAPPFVTGSLSLTDSAYVIEVNAISPDGPVRVIDEGAYSIDGRSWSQDSARQQPPSVGTYEFDGVLLRFDVVSDEVRVVSTWRRM